jgi:hypothetical protein
MCWANLTPFALLALGAGLEAILFEEMAPEDAFVRAVVALVQATRGGRSAAIVPPPRCPLCCVSISVL